MTRVGDKGYLRSLFNLRGLAILFIVSAGAVFLPHALFLVSLAGLFLFLCAFYAPRLVWYAVAATAPLIGWMVSLQLPGALGARIFQGGIEVAVGECIALALVIALCVTRVWNWLMRRKNEPWFWPLLGAWLLLVGAHMISVFSGAAPDPLLVLKFSLRPLLWVYVWSILLPVNLIKTKKHLITTLWTLLGVGVLFALQGLWSLQFGSDDQTALPRAHPLSIFGVFPIGINHNVLAEWMSYLAPVGFALAVLVKKQSLRRIAYAIAGLTALVAILTFARSAWITLGVQILFLSLTIWRPFLRRKPALIAWGAVMAIPLLLFMGFFMMQSGVQSSTDSRAMLIGIAWSLFVGSPWLGVGAGTFVDRVSSVWLFQYEYGGPLDSHGVIQKVMAETGIVGLAAFAYVIVAVGRTFYAGWKGLTQKKEEEKAYMYLLAGAIGAFVYQLFNTTYWSPKLWLPVGIALVAARVLRSEKEEVI